MPGVSSCVQLCGGTGTPPHYTWTTASNNHDNNITIISDYLQSPAGHLYGSVSMITKNNKIEKRKVKSFSKQTTPEVVSSTAASHQGVPAAPPHHERSKVVEDVSQSDEDGGVALQPPEGAVLLQQPVILGWGAEGRRVRRQVRLAVTSRLPLELTWRSMEVERTFLMKPSSLWAFSSSAVGGSCRGRYPSTGYVRGEESRSNQPLRRRA